MISKALLQYIRVQATITDEKETFPEEVFKRLAEEGLLEITLPGYPLDFNEKSTAVLLQLFKLIGGADLSVGRIYEGHINALYLISLYASPLQKQRWFADVVEKHSIFSVWNTQAQDGVSLEHLGNGKYRLKGSKSFCSGAGFIRRPVITGELQREDKRGWQMCVVPVEKVNPIVQDASFWQPMGMKASVSYKMDFSGIELTEDDLLGQLNDYYSQPTFSGGAIRFAAVQLGGAESLLDATKSYLQSLERTGDNFQKARLAEMAWLITSGNQWLQCAGNNTDRWLENEPKSNEIVAYANMTRTAIEEICLRTMQLAERCIGARGLMRPNPYERIHRDLTFYLRQPAPDATIMAIADFVFTQKCSADELWS